MTRSEIEPGLLRLFRWFVGIRLALLLILNLAGQDRSEGDLLFAPIPGIVMLGLLLVYLLSTRLQNRMGRWYLPIALWVATIGPIVENGVTIRARLVDGATPNEAVSDYWLLFFYLFVPLILIAWQYRYRWVVVFTIGTFFLDALLTMGPLEGTQANLTLVGALLLGRAALFLFVGLVIAKLVAALRTQREALAESAISRERLAMSEERRRLARELHDTLAHTLSAVAVQLEGVRSLWHDDEPRAKQMLDQSLSSARLGLTEARRSISALRAEPIEEHGLVVALGELCQSVSESSGLEVTCDSDIESLGDSGLEHTVYRVATEALTNVVRHASASKAHVHLTRDEDSTRLTVQDDGHGFDSEADPGPDRHGIRGMSERALLIDAQLRIESKEAGTLVTLEIPGAS